MKNYKECSEQEFSEAMKVMRDIKRGTVSIEAVPKPQLVIMYTKMAADMQRLSGIGNAYAFGLYMSTKHLVDTLKKELERRRQ